MLLEPREERIIRMQKVLTGSRCLHKAMEMRDFVIRTPLEAFDTAVNAGAQCTTCVPLSKRGFDIRKERNTV